MELFDDKALNKERKTHIKKAIVTGANGFVGSAVCKALSEHGVNVVALVRGKESDISRIERLNNISVNYCDMDNYKLLPTIISDRDIDVMYHFAWSGSAGSNRGNASVQISNIYNSIELLKVCAEIHCRRFVFAASIMEYEIHDAIEANKNIGINNLYSAAKMSCDYMLRILSYELKIQYIRCVISNIYGPGENSPRLINTSIRKILKGDKPLFSEGMQMYDFIYVDDAAEIFYLLGEKGKPEKTYYIGSTCPKKLREFIEELHNAIDANADIGLGELPFNGVSLDYSLFDVYSVKKDTGYVPLISFSEGVKRTAEWIKEKENGDN